MNNESMTLEEFINKYFDGNKSEFARFNNNIARQQVNQWIKGNFIVVNSTLYSPRRELAKPEIKRNDMDINKIKKPSHLNYFYCSSGTPEEERDLSNAAVMEISSTEKIYFMDDGIWFSCYDWNDNIPSRVRIKGDQRLVAGTGSRRKEKIIPAKYTNEMDAVKAFMNAREYWEENYKADYDKLNVLSSAYQGVRLENGKYPTLSLFFV
ncbi:hypothetical protein [Xenorhabdus bovienii]|uniref:Uncharacterized protein n=1 Tax=Xenorhabdus bovienii str. kraussei Becker Underwood TaxID=1398204 RepID=A0A077PIA8_XENBV|nr:hypothetical protein [Xenorhabdus bovienii]CDH24090.1 conserved hypothetical protein [Xenorhabdus bovienii str. kraussei Becker Underwood]